MKKNLLDEVEGFSERLLRSKGSYLERTAEEFTQAELAERVGKLVGRNYDQTTARSWFNGIIPPAKTIAALAMVYRVSPGWLTYNEGVMLAGHHPPATVMPQAPMVEASKRRQSK